VAEPQKQSNDKERRKELPDKAVWQAFIIEAGILDRQTRWRMYGLVGIVTIFSMPGCYRPPKEAELVKNFDANRPEFDRLLTMATADR
jgi:hypothetical protein